MQVKDLYGNTIKVTDLKAAIEQAEFLSNSPFKQSPFVLVNGLSKPIKGRENESHTVGQYNKDLLSKLNQLST